MEKIIYKNCSYILIHEDNSGQLLLNAFDPLNNHSSVPMHYMTEKNGQLSTQFYWFDMIQTVIKEIPPSENSTVIISLLLRLISCLAKKARPFNFLWIGNEMKQWLSPLNSLLQEFNSANRLYWLSEQTIPSSAPSIIPIQTKITEYPFPAQFYDCVIIDNTSIKTIPIGSLIPKTINSIVPFGKLLIGATQNNSISKLQSLLETAAIFPIDKFSVIDSDITPTIAQKIFATTKTFEVQQAKTILKENILALKPLLDSTSPNDYDNLITAVTKLENDLLLLYPYLISSDIKFLVNRLKETMIEYRLEFDDLDQINNAYTALIDEMQRFGDFN